MKKLNKEILVNLTKLCRIHCSEDELATLLENLESILGYIDQMEEVETEGVPECHYVSESSRGSFMREDEPDQSLDRKTFLDNSPSHVGGMIRVPTVIKF